MNMKRIGLITSGGDCGGLNAVLKGAALTAQSRSATTLVIPNGYAGLYNLIDMEDLVELTPTRVDAVQASLAGSEAGHSRVKISKIKDRRRYDRIKAGLAKHAIDGLVISGGDDTGAVILDLDNHKIPCIHAPKTMDLDLQPYSVGGDSTINRIAQFVRDLRTTAVTHNRILVVEVFGRNAGHTAFRGGVAAEVDCILIPEIRVDVRTVYKHLRERFMRRVCASDVNAGTYMIVVAEGVTDQSGRCITKKLAGKDAFGHGQLGGVGAYVTEQLKQLIDKDKRMERFMKDQGMFVPGVYERPEIRSIVPSHLVRCGQSSAFDANFGLQVGAAAVHLLLAGKKGMTVVDVQGGVLQYMPTSLAIQQRHVDTSQVALFEEMGFCFGREPVPFRPQLSRFPKTKTPARHL